MESRNYYRLKQKCWRKRGWWATKKAAHKRAREIFKESGIRMYPYMCSGCGQVHLTKQESAKGQVL